MGCFFERGWPWMLCSADCHGLNPRLSVFRLPGFFIVYQNASPVPEVGWIQLQNLRFSFLQIISHFSERLGMQKVEENLRAVRCGRQAFWRLFKKIPGT